MLEITNDQLAEFKRQVLAHVLRLPPDQWHGFRHHDALMEDRWIGALGANPDATPEMLVGCAAAVSTIPLVEVLKIPGPQEVVGLIEQRPIYFLTRSGIYIWSAAPEGKCIDLWLSHPAYPRGWR